MAAIRATRRPIQDGVERSNVRICRMSQFPGAPAEHWFRIPAAQDLNVVPHPGGVEKP